MNPLFLPDDIDQLKALVRQQQEQVRRHQELVHNRNLAMDDLARRHKDALEEIVRLRARLFGRKTEKISPNQLTLLDLAPDPTAAPTADDSSSPAPKPNRKGNGKRRSRSGHGRGRLPKHLETLVVTNENQGSTVCSCCGGDLKTIGEDRSERLEWVPGHFRRLIVVRRKRACPKCPGKGVITQPPPAFGLQRALAADGLVAKIIDDKYALHLPLNRQAKVFKRSGVDIAVSTMCGWLKQSASLLEHLVAVILAELVAGRFIQSDGTGLPVLEGQRNRPHRSCLWSFSDGEQVVFAATRSHSQDHPARILKGFQGVLLADGASNYNLIAAQEGVTRAGCWAHARRKFFEARESHPFDAFEALGHIREIFRVEAETRHLDAEARQRIRKDELGPRLQRFRKWLDEKSEGARPSSLFGKAVGYTRNQWPTLVVFLEHGDVPPDNNGSERSLRSPVVGRKNWMFAGSEGGAKVAATCFTIVGSCVMAGIDPYRYLRDVLHRLPDAKPSDLAALTPKAWARRHAQLTG